MLDKLKADFDGIIELVNKTPAPLQETAFKMILEQWFSANTAPKPRTPPRRLALGSGAPAAPGGVPDAVKPFLTANAITTDILEKVFHPTGPGAQLLASSIPGNGKASKVGQPVAAALRQAGPGDRQLYLHAEGTAGARRPLRLLRLAELLHEPEGEQELLQPAGEGRGPRIERAGS